ncbi:MAG: hypothetical protein GY859_03380, partial [Desulfobacterales bacterium]|nr:hypothetical protein [Desulfobacterales bacterium]
KPEPPAEKAPPEGEAGLPEPLPEPEAPELIRIADNVPEVHLRENHAPDYSRVIFAFIPLLTVLMLFLFRLYRNRDVSGEKLQQEKARNAYKSFLRNISPLEKRNPDVSTYHRDLGNGIQEFLRDRFSAPSEEIDAPFFRRLTESGKITPEMVDEITGVMETVDHHRYSAASFDPAEAADLLKKTKKVLKQCR